MDWTRAEYGGIDDAGSRLSERYGVKGGDIRFYVRAGGERFSVRLDNCASPGGIWQCGSGIDFPAPDVPLIPTTLESVRPADDEVREDPTGRTRFRSPPQRRPPLPEIAPGK